jgi:hypothetical protein
VLHLPPGAPATPRDLLRAALAAHRAVDPFLPLPPRRETTLEAALALARTEPERMLAQLRALAGSCEIELLWRPGPGSARPEPPRQPTDDRAPGCGTAWLRQRALSLDTASLRKSALCTLAGALGAGMLRCHSGPGGVRAVLLSARDRTEAIVAALPTAPRSPALAGGSLLITGPWPLFSAAAGAGTGLP